MLKVKQECLAIDDDIRWLVAIIFDSGMRLSEAAGLMTHDIHLDAEIPYIALKPNPHRRLKTASSERNIHLIGMSLWAARRLKHHSVSLYCFPTYSSAARCNSNSASATLNTWINTIVSSNDVIHGMRHSFRDRLRAVEAPTERIDQLGRWTLMSVGQVQGHPDGYQSVLIICYMEKMSDPS